MNNVPEPVEVDTEQIPYEQGVSYSEIADDSFEYDGEQVEVSVRESANYHIRIRIDDANLDTVTQVGVEWAYQYEFPGNGSVIAASNGEYRTRIYKLSRLYYREGRKFLEEDLRDGD